MDGGRRLLRPVREAFVGFQPSLPAYVGASNISLTNVRGHGASRGHRAFARRQPISWSAWLLAIVTARGAGSVIAVIFLLGIGAYGAMLGGEYASFTAAQGTPVNMIARTLGFGIKTIGVSGAHELSKAQVLAAVGIERTSSLPFLDAAKIRDRLKTLPLVKDASVSKLYPNRVVIEIAERKPFALWQKDGDVQIVAADGTAIDTLRDAHLAALPLVVGEDANVRIAEYLALLDASADLRPRIKAGILIAKRRWTLKMDNGVLVALPESGAVAAVAKLAELQRDHGVLDKDVLALDLRFPGRLIARLPAETADARAQKFAQKSKTKGGRT